MKTELLGLFWDVIRFLLMALSPAVALVVFVLAVIVVVELFGGHCEDDVFGPRPGQSGYHC